MQLYESMTRVTVGAYIVRVWSAESTPRMGPSPTVLRAVLELQILPSVHEGLISIVLDALPEVNAYEILNPSGNGLVVYRDWP